MSIASLLALTIPLQIMKLEYLSEGSQDCPLIRIYGSDLDAVAHLLKAFKALGLGQRSECAIHELPGIESIGGYKLFVRIGKEDKGGIQLGHNIFDWVLSAETWLQVKGLTEPFTKATTAHVHQWLDESSDVSILITNAENGAW